MFKKSFEVNMYEVDGEDKIFTRFGLETHILFSDKIEVIKEHEKTNCFIRLSSGKMYLVDMEADLLRKKAELLEQSQI